MPAHTTGRIIPLTQGFFAIVDEEDYERVAQFRWHWSGGYAKRKVGLPDGKRTVQYMARFIMGEPQDMEVDHRSMNPLDNRKSNLRLATIAQNRQNRAAPKTNKSGYKGVYWHKASGKWTAQISSGGGKPRCLGYFATPQEAAERYRQESERLHGEFSRVDAPEIPEQRLTSQMERPNKINNTSGIEGVCWTNADKAWKASIQINKRSCFLGNFKRKEDAVLARKRAEIVLPSLDCSTLTGGILRSAIAHSAVS